MHLPARFSRRAFLQTASLTLAGTLARSPVHAASKPAQPLFSKFGIAAPMAQAAELRAAGVEFLTESVDRLLAPEKPEEEFVRNLATQAATPLPVLACNGFIRPKHLRCVGADANHDAVLAWAETTFARAKRAQVPFIVFGSAGARQLRDGWTKEQADPQFKELLSKMGPLAASAGITVVVEQLRAQECNYINHLSEGAELIRAVNHARIRMLADLYHMTVMDDTPDDLRRALDVVVHIEIAEKEGRTAPGVSGQNFRPFFRVLRDAGYRGALNIEGSWKLEQVAPALAEIRRQVAEA